MKLTRISTLIITMREEKPRPIVQCCQPGRNFPMWLQFIRTKKDNIFLSLTPLLPSNDDTLLCRAGKNFIFREADETSKKINK